MGHQGPLELQDQLEQVVSVDAFSTKRDVFILIFIRFMIRYAFNRNCPRNIIVSFKRDHNCIICIFIIITYEYHINLSDDEL